MYYIILHFQKKNLRKSKLRLFSGLSQTSTNADAMAGNVAAVLNYGVNHPYGEIQTEDDVNNMTLENIKSYYNTYFKPNNAYLVIVGDITPAEAKGRCGEILFFLEEWRNTWN